MLKVTFLTVVNLSDFESFRFLFMIVTFLVFKWG